MKNMNKITGLLRTSALCLTLAAMAACDAEDFTRTAGDIPGKDDLANVGGVLRREKTPDQISALKLSEEQTTTDAVFYQLTQPAAADVTVTVDADATLVDEYNKDKQGDAKLTLFPLENVTFEGGKTLTVKRGEKTSPALTVTLSREGVEKGAYLLPLRATVANNDMSPSEKDQVIYYRILVGEIVPETQLDAYAFKIVGYVNTEEMNPLMGTKFYAETFDRFQYDNPNVDRYRSTPPRGAKIRQDDTTGHARHRTGSAIRLEQPRQIPHALAEKQS